MNSILQQHSNKQLTSQSLHRHSLSHHTFLSPPIPSSPSVSAMRKRIRLSLVERVEGGDARDNSSDSDHIQIEEEPGANERLIRPEDAFPVFVPKRRAGAKEQKKSWTHLAPSSKQILLQFARRAKKLPLPSSHHA